MSGAAQPHDGYQPLPRRPLENRPYVIRVYPEGGIGRTRDYDLSSWPVSDELRDLFANVLERATGAGGTRRTESSALSFFNNLRRIAYDIDEFASSIRSVRDFTAFFVTDLYNRRGRACVETLRVALRGVDGVSSAFHRALYAPRSRNRDELIAPYSDAEFRDIAREARSQLRSALARIRAGQARLGEWRQQPADSANQEESARHGRLLDVIERTGDVPRTANGAVSIRQIRPWNVRDLCTSLFPTQSEAASALILLIAMTGQNSSTIRNLRLDHLRASSPAGDDLPVATVRASKPRRGPYRSEMTLQLTGLPAWLGEAKRPNSDRDELDSPYGVFQAALELSASARKVIKSDALLVYWGTQNMTTEERFRPDGSRAPRLRELRIESVSEWHGPHGGKVSGEKIDTRRLRRAYLDRHQKPVAQTAATLNNIYLARSTAILAESQQIVAETLSAEIDRNKHLTETMVILSSEVTLAREDPTAIAAAHGLTTDTLDGVLSGELDTVGCACVDHKNSPFDHVGTPCTASFLLCLACPNARSEPRHIPTQALMLRVIGEKKRELPPGVWSAQYGDAHSRLSYLLEAQGANTDKAAALATQEDQEIVAALVNGELEIR